MSADPLIEGSKNEHNVKIKYKGSRESDCCNCFGNIEISSLRDLDGVSDECIKRADMLDNLSLVAPSRSKHSQFLKSLLKNKPSAVDNKEITRIEETGEFWKEIGFQSSNPYTDWRGGGELALENLIYLCENYPLLISQVWDPKPYFPFALASINITRILQYHFGIMRNSDKSCNILVIH